MAQLPRREPLLCLIRARKDRGKGRVEGQDELVSKELHGRLVGEDGRRRRAIVERRIGDAHGDLSGALRHFDRLPRPVPRGGLPSRAAAAPWRACWLGCFTRRTRAIPWLSWRSRPSWSPLACWPRPCPPAAPVGSTPWPPCARSSLGRGSLGQPRCYRWPARCFDTSGPRSLWAAALRPARHFDRQGAVARTHRRGAALP